MEMVTVREDDRVDISMFGITGAPNEVLKIDLLGEIHLFLGWVRGKKKYLDFY